MKDKCRGEGKRVGVFIVLNTERPKTKTWLLNILSLAIVFLIALDASTQLQTSVTATGTYAALSMLAGALVPLSVQLAVTELIARLRGSSTDFLLIPIPTIPPTILPMLMFERGAKSSGEAATICLMGAVAGLLTAIALLPLSLALPIYPKEVTSFVVPTPPAIDLLPHTANPIVDGAFMYLITLTFQMLPYTYSPTWYLAPSEAALIVGIWWYALFKNDALLGEMTAPIAIAVLILSIVRGRRVVADPSEGATLLHALLIATILALSAPVVRWPV